MLKIRLAFIIPFLSALALAGASAQSKAEISLRFSEHEEYSRIVFEAGDEMLIKNTGVTTAKNRIIVRFPAPFNLNAKDKHGLDISQQGQILTISLTAPFKTRVLRLSSPPRLSIDILTETTANKPGVQEPGSAKTAANFRVVLDPGHGGYDSGIVSGSLKEKDFALLTARNTESLLIKNNKQVYLTRKADQSMSISDRALFANQKAPDAFISIHLSPDNNFVIYTPFIEHGRPDMPVSEAYDLMHRQRRYAEKSKALAEGIGKAIKGAFNVDVAYREMALPLLNSTGSAAVMIEIPATDAVKASIPDVLLKGIGFYAAK